MYNLKIFENINELWQFLIDNNIIDYSFKKFDFQFMNSQKTNYFLSYKLN